MFSECIGDLDAAQCTMARQRRSMSCYNGGSGNAIPTVGNLDMDVYSGMQVCDALYGLFKAVRHGSANDPVFAVPCSSANTVGLILDDSTKLCRIFNSDGSQTAPCGSAGACDCSCDFPSSRHRRTINKVALTATAPPAPTPAVTPAPGITTFAAATIENERGTPELWAALGFGALAVVLACCWLAFRIRQSNASIKFDQLKPFGKGTPVFRKNPVGSF